MTDAEINAAIAEVCGFTRGQIGWWQGPNSMPFIESGLPDYCHDLNAMAGAEATLAVRYEYVNKLGLVNLGVESLQWPCVFATARQRAEAFLRVKGKWKDA